MKGLPLKSAGVEVFQELVLESKIMRIISHSLSILTILVFLASAPFLGDEVDFMISTYIYKNRCESCSHIDGRVYLLIHVITLFIHGLSFTPYINFFLYKAIHMKYQFRLLNKFILKLNRGAEFHINDIRYQERVAHQLRCLILKYHKIKRLVLFWYEESNQIIIVMFIFGLLIFIASTIFIKLEISPRSNFRMYLQLGAWFSLLVSVSLISQKITDEAEEVFLNACKCYWENWNNQNRRTFLMILIETKTPFALCGAGVIDVNSKLILKMWRLGNSVVGLLMYKYTHEMKHSLDDC